MGENVKLKAANGHEFDAYVARPAGSVIGGLVVVQEAFGVNRHIRSVADDYARDGFLAVAPALYDRIEPRCGTGLYRGRLAEGNCSCAKERPCKRRKGHCGSPAVCAQARLERKPAIHRLLLWGADALPGVPAACTKRGRGLLRRVYRPSCCRESIRSSDVALWQAGSAYPPSRMSTRCRPCIRRFRSSGTTQGTASTATSARATTRMQPNWLASIFWHF